MGRITSSIGLVTGLDIAKTVEQLVALQARPRDQLVKLNQTREQQQLAISGLATQLVGLQLSAGRLRLGTVLDQRKATSSAADTLSVSVTGRPATGSYEFTPLRLAQAQRLLSSGLASRTTPVGSGEVTFRFGGFVDGDVSLATLNQGAGVAGGSIRVTDRAGASAQIDLRLARTVNDVVRAINAADAIGVRAELADNAIRLVDTTGASTANLQVDEVGTGTTAAGLGLAGIDVAASTATGTRIYRLYDGLALDQLNDGRGVRFDAFLDDLSVSLRDGSQVRVDFARQGTAPELLTATTPATGRPDAQVTFQAVSAQPELVGVQVRFVNDATIARGSETVAYDAGAKTLTIRIDEGNTTAQDVVRALDRNSTVNKVFSAELTGSNAGTGLVIEPDGVTIDGPRSTLTTAGTNGVNARLKLTATSSTPELDNYQLVFQGGAAGIGQETVTVNTNAKTITVAIAEGESTAASVTTALNANADVAARFTAETGAAVGGDGTGLVTLADGGTTAGGTVLSTRREATLGELLATLNAAAPGKLEAELAADGERIVLKDLSTDNGGTFAVSDLNDSRAAADLGLTLGAAADTITGRRVLSGAGTTLLSSLAGGRGLGTLGLLDLTDRSGAQATIDLSAAETLADVADVINTAGLALTARINQARNGLEIVDTSGSTAGNLRVANGDATDSADKLQLAIDAAVARVNSRSLDRQVASENTKLADLNAGAGVTLGTIRLTDRTGASRELDLKAAEVVTIGDVLRELNGAGLEITARINDTGDGILLADTVGSGASVFRVSDVNGTTAAELRIAGSSALIDLEGTPTQALDGRTTFTVSLGPTDSLDDLVNRLNATGGGVGFSVVNDGSGVNPFRISLISSRTGRAGEVLVDLDALGLALEESAAAQDAVLALGAFGPTGGQVVTSASNVFREVVTGLSLTVQKTATAPITINVTQDDAPLTAAVKDVVDRYNAIWDQVRSLGSRNADRPGILAGSSALLQVETALSNLFGSRFGSRGALLSTLGIRFVPLNVGADGTLADEDAAKAGKLQFDAAKLQASLATDAAGVREFFSTNPASFTSRIERVIDRLAANDGALLVNQIETINRQISDGQRRLTLLNTLLESQRERLTNSFNRAELAISKLRDLQNALTAIQPVPISTSNGSN